MAKIIKQFRYYEDGSANNYPQELTAANMISGKLFFNRENGLTAMTQLSIQAIPGTQFYINNSVDPIIIGQTGLYELNLENLSEISSLKFEKSSIENMSNYKSHMIIVDAIYHKEG